MKNKKIIIVAILFLLLVGLILFFIFGGSGQKPATDGLPTPTTETPTVFEQTGQGDPNAFQELEKVTVTGYPLFPKTPHRETNWTLDYVDALHLAVTVKGTITEAIKTEVLKWIKDQGVDPATHQIDWISSR